MSEILLWTHDLGPSRWWLAGLATTTLFWAILANRPGPATAGRELGPLVPYFFALAIPGWQLREWMAHAGSDIRFAAWAFTSFGLLLVLLPLAFVLLWRRSPSIGIPRPRAALWVAILVLVVAIAPLLDPRGLRESGPAALRGVVLAAIGGRLVGALRGAGADDARRLAFALLLFGTECVCEMAALTMEHAHGFHWMGGVVAADQRRAIFLRLFELSDRLAAVAAAELAVTVTIVLIVVPARLRRLALLMVLFGTLCVAAADPRPFLEDHYCGDRCIAL